MELCFIENVITENTGGGTMVDFIILKDGRVIGVNEDYVVLYKSMEDFYEYNDSDTIKPHIALNEY